MLKVSVIIPTYNRPIALKEAVRSVLTQGVEEVEVIIIDDASDSKYRLQIEALSKEVPQVTLVRSKENQGVAQSRNIGIGAAKGDFLLFLDDDDVLLPEMLLHVMSAFDGATLDVVSCLCEISGDHLPAKQLNTYNRQLKSSFDLYPMSDRPMEHLFLYHPQIHTFLIRRKSLGDFRFSSELRYGEDIMFWMTLANKGLKFKRIYFVGCKYRLHAWNASAKAGFVHKIFFYQYLLGLPAMSPVVRNLCWIKMSVLAVKQKDHRFIPWFFQSLLRPWLFAKHVKYYIQSL